ncbi:MAG TPA: disulfide oxidoreductase [Patescibacteria group bacterium]|jgi:disulfide bond formation protein DsbB|nr:disulfide oxidoreductase [Patescibacteria group bacterium]
MKKFIQDNALYFAFAVALVAMLGSLYFSQIAHFPPCVLCWYQRITTYPLVAIIGFAIYKKSKDILLPAFVLVSIGWVIGLYHNLLYYKILPEAAAPCIAGVSCTTKFIQWFGFVTIPLLALSASTLILILLIIHWKAAKGPQIND